MPTVRRGQLVCAACIVLVLFGGQAQGQTTGSARVSTPRPAAEMQTLAKALTGRWAITETFALSGNNSAEIAAGGVGHGEEVWRSGPGGFTLMEEAHDFTPAGEVYIVGYMWWDRTAKKFAGMECNSQWPQVCDVASAISRVSLSWDGTRLVVDFRSKEDPRRIVWHEVFSDITPTSFVQTGDIGQPDGSLKRLVTIRATRIGKTL
jgi:hypothetical protein